MSKTRIRSVLILSPQSWSHLKISKHHYAIAYAASGARAVFFEPPSFGFFPRLVSTHTNEGVEILKIKWPVPDFLRVKTPSTYRFCFYFFLHFFGKRLKGFDLAIDFGCYSIFNNLKIFKARKTIFFPVDDFPDLPISCRGANLVLTVSTVIQSKLSKFNCKFIHHGLPSTFSIPSTYNYKINSSMKVGISGNIFIRFIDYEILKEIILLNPEVEFNFYGSTAHSQAIQWQVEWFHFLNNSPNVLLHGVVSSHDLARAYQDIDIFLLCYKPDYIHFHGENSHKVIEFLSTGKTCVSSYLSLYDNSDLIEMAPKDQNEALISLFNRVTSNLEDYNSQMKFLHRTKFAMENTYSKHILNIEKLIQ